MWSYLLCLSIFLLSFELGLAQDENPCYVNSLNGRIRGKLAMSGTGVEMCTFFGIPYAKAPVGDLRFKRPIPIGNWAGEHGATVLPNTCSQYSGFPNISEDCLYLNIWAPISIFNSSSRSATVMIWIHGGGLTSDTSTNDDYNGAVLAGDQNVIFASMQYRLGPIGFLYFGTEDAPGNMGLLDQNMAIKWLYDNIGEFGGNKEDITIFGESAGGWSVSYHLLSPLTRPYINRAIVMSGTTPSRPMWRSKEEALQFAYEVAEHAQCYSPSDDPQKEIPEIIACMRTKHMSVIDYATFVQKSYIETQGSATVDDYFLPDTPENLLKELNNTEIDVMIGNVRDEGTTMLVLYSPQYFNASKTPSLTFNEFETFLRGMVNNLPEYEQDAIVTHYTNWENFNDVEGNARKIMGVATDYTFVCPSVNFAQKWASNTQKVYFYYFTHPMQGLNETSEWLGAAHFVDVEYLFGGPLLTESRPENEKNLSRKMQELFVNFAKTGIPSENWTDYTPSHPVYLNLNGTLISDKSTDNMFGPRPYDCSFWNIELPRLREFAERGEPSA